VNASFRPRDEDPRLLTGAGRFFDDTRGADEAFGVFVRSPHAAAVIRGIDTEAAHAAPGVLAVLTAAELDAAGVRGVAQAIPVPGGSEMVTPVRPSLAHDRVRHVGDAVVLVVAETEHQARDAAERVVIDYEPLDSVTDVTRAVSAGAPLVYDEASGNVALDWRPYPAGDRTEFDNIFAAAAHVARVRLINQRIVMAPMEPRGALAEYDAVADRFILHTASQSAHAMRVHVAWSLGVPAGKVRVISNDVGGAFGMRTANYPEYPALLIAARMLGRGIRWVSTRAEGFLSDNQARDTVIEGALALDANGKFLALDIEEIAALGAYQTSHGAFIATANFARCLPCMYDIPHIGTRIRCVFTNTVPTGPYRGAGRPEANYCVERLVDAAAHLTGLDRIEIRRRNLISADQMPYKTPVGTVYDSGDFAAVMDAALTHADVAGYAARKARTEATGKHRGLGVSCFLEIAGGQPGEGAGLSFPGGRAGETKLRVGIGMQASGQGHVTLWRRMVADRLEVPDVRIEVVHGDSDAEVPSAGAVASRGTMSVGGALVRAIDTLLEKGKRAAAHVLEAAEADIVYKAGVFEIAGTDRRIGLFDLAERVGADLDTNAVYDAPPSFPNGVHIAEVEIDPDTGATKLAAYTCVDDCGLVLQPVLVEGQVQGGVAQGVGQALLEHGFYDDAGGQLTAGTFMDYAMPRADDLPDIISQMHPVLCRTNPLGVKGVGEAGTTASLAAVMSAVEDAAGIAVDMPATAERVWRAMRGG